MTSARRRRASPALDRFPTVDEMRAEPALPAERYPDLVRLRWIGAPLCADDQLRDHLGYRWRLIPCVDLDAARTAGRRGPCGR